MDSANDTTIDYADPHDPHITIHTPHLGTPTSAQEWGATLSAKTNCNTIDFADSYYTHITIHTPHVDTPNSIQRLGAKLSTKTNYTTPHNHTNTATSSQQNQTMHPSHQQSTISAIHQTPMQLTPSHNKINDRFSSTQKSNQQAFSKHPGSSSMHAYAHFDTQPLLPTPTTTKQLPSSPIHDHINTPDSQADNPYPDIPQDVLNEIRNASLRNWTRNHTDNSCWNDEQDDLSPSNGIGNKRRLHETEEDRRTNYELNNNDDNCIEITKKNKKNGTGIEINNGNKGVTLHTDEDQGKDQCTTMVHNNGENTNKHSRKERDSLRRQTKFDARKKAKRAAKNEKRNELHRQTQNPIHPEEEETL